jgi:hypothetical protein
MGRLATAIIKKEKTAEDSLNISDEEVDEILDIIKG